MVNLSTWFVYALISAFGFGITTILWKMIMDRGLSPILTITYVITLIGIFLWSYVLIGQKVVLPTSSVIISLLVLSSFIAAIANWASFTSLKFVSNPGYSRAVTSASILIAFVISMFVFKPKFDIIGLIGVLLIISGIILLSRVS